MAMAAKKKADGSGSKVKKAAAPNMAAAMDEAGGVGSLEMDPGLRRDDGLVGGGLGGERTAALDEGSGVEPEIEVEVKYSAAPDVEISGVKALPVKSPDVLKRIVYVDVRKNIQPDDFTGIHAKIREHFEGALNLRKSLALLRDELRDCKKGIRAEEAEVEELNAMIASGVMELKEERVIETWDYGAGSIASEAADEGVRAAMVEIPMREMLATEKQRSLSFKTPQEDCYYCKYVGCRAAGRVCRNFADCAECPDFTCEGVFINNGGDVFCGFGKRPAAMQGMSGSEGIDLDESAMVMCDDEFKERDCFFCQNLRCDADMTDSCGRKSDCAECDSASCSNRISGAECSLGKTCGTPF